MLSAIEVTEVCPQEYKNGLILKIKGKKSVLLFSRMSNSYVGMRWCVSSFISEDMVIYLQYVNINIFKSTHGFTNDNLYIAWVRSSLSPSIYVDTRYNPYSALSNKCAVWNNRVGYYIGLFGNNIKNYFLFNKTFWKN